MAECNMRMRLPHSIAGPPTRARIQKGNLPACFLSCAVAELVVADRAFAALVELSAVAVPAAVAVAAAEPVMSVAAAAVDGLQTAQTSDLSRHQQPDAQPQQG